MEKYSATFEKIDPVQFPPRIENEGELLHDEKASIETLKNVETERINRYIDSLPLSPYQKGRMRHDIGLLENPQADWAYVMRNKGRMYVADEDMLPLEIYKNENLVALVKKRIYDVVVSGECDESDLVRAMDFFGIEKEFFKQKDFLPYRRRKWLERIEHGDPLEDLSGSQKNSLFINEDKESEEILEQKRKEEELAYGPFMDAIKNPDDPEIKASALKGMILNCFGRKFTNDRSALNSKKTIEEYKKIFKITDKEFVEAIIDDARDHGFAARDAAELEKYLQLRTDYPLLNQFFSSPAGRELLQKEIARRQYREGDVGQFMKAFSLNEEDIDAAAVEFDEKLFGLKDLSQGRIDSEYYFYDIARASKHLSDKELRDFFAQPGNAERAVKGLAVHCQYSWELEKCVNLASRLGFSEEQMKEIGREGIVVNCRKSNLDKDSITKIKKSFGLSDDELKEALNWGVIKRIKEGNDTREFIKQVKDMFSLENFAVSPAIDKAVKEVYIKKLEQRRLGDLEELEANFKISWKDDNSEMRAERRDAVKKSLCSASDLNSFRTVKDLDNYLTQYFPETHKILWLQDKEFKQLIEEELSSNLPYFYSGFNHHNEFVRDVATYFNIPVDSIKLRLQEKIEQGEYLNGSYSQALTFFFPEIDIKAENLKYLSAHGSEEIKNDFEEKRWKNLKEIQNLGSIEVNQEIEKVLSLQKEALLNPSASLEVISYAIEAVSELGEGIEYLKANYYPVLVNFYLETDISKLKDLVLQKDIAYFSALEDEKRQKVLKEIDTSDLIASPLIAFVREEESVELLLEVARYGSAMAGIKSALDAGLPIPDYIYKALYKRSRRGEEGEMPEGYKSAILGYMSMPELDKALLTNVFIVKEIAQNPENISSIQKMVKKLPPGLLNGMWSYVYPSLKDVPEKEFEFKKSLFTRLNAVAAAWPLKDESFGRLSDILLAASEEKREQYFRLLELKGKQMSSFSEAEWAEALMSYVSAAEETNRLELKEKSKKTVIDLFNGPYKDKALRGMQEAWFQSLRSENASSLPLDLYLVAKTIEDAGGAGNLKHVEALGNFAFLYQKLLNQANTAPRTKEEIKNLLLSQQERMEHERWSFDERSEMCNLSGDILKAAPSLYASFAPLLDKLSAKEMNAFAREILPLYQAQLIIIQKNSNNNNTESYDPRELVQVRSALKEFTDRLEKAGDRGDTLSTERTRLAARVTEGFKSRFGIQKVPEFFSQEHVRSVQNCIRYIGNINNRDTEKKTIIAFYLALELNSQWEAFRQGKDIKAEDYLAEDQARVIAYLLREKKASYELPLKIAGISGEKAVRFQELLQEETMSSMIGNIQTIDVKLGDIKRNIDELADPDIYDNDINKKLIQLLTDKGKSVGAVLHL